MLAACVPAAPPAPPPVASPEPVPAPTAPPPPADWRDRPASPGTWRYAVAAGGSVAEFGRPGAPADAALRCDRAGGRVLLVRAGAAAGPLTVRTGTATRTLPATAAATGAAAAIPANDRLLDAMAFSRGRFALEAAGVAPLSLPAWAEVGRVIEDCRAP